MLVPQRMQVPEVLPPGAMTHPTASTHHCDSRRSDVYVGPMRWPPQIGGLLPRAADAWCEEHKWTGWILAERGHGPEFERVLRVRRDDADVLWKAIAARILIEPITGLRDLGFHGLNCEVDIWLTIAGRTSRVRTVWSYDGPASAPRLVSAYPKV